VLSLAAGADNSRALERGWGWGWRWGASAPAESPNRGAEQESVLGC